MLSIVFFFMLQWAWEIGQVGHYFTSFLFNGCLKNVFISLQMTKKSSTKRRKFQFFFFLTFAKLTSSHLENSPLKYSEWAFWNLPTMAGRILTNGKSMDDQPNSSPSYDNSSTETLESVLRPLSITCTMFKPIKSIVTILQPIRRRTKAIITEHACIFPFFAHFAHWSPFALSFISVSFDWPETTCIDCLLGETVILLISSTDF